MLKIIQILVAIFAFTILWNEIIRNVFELPYLEFYESAAILLVSNLLTGGFYDMLKVEPPANKPTKPNVNSDKTITI